MGNKMSPAMRSVLLSRPTPHMPLGAIGLWFFDEYQSSPRPYIPNAMAPSGGAPTNLFYEERRFIAANPFGGSAGTALGADGKTYARKVASGATYGSAGFAGLASGQRTLAFDCVSDDLTTSATITAHLFGAAPTYNVTGSWQRFSFTGTMDSSTPTYPGWFPSIDLRYDNIWLSAGATDLYLTKPTPSGHLVLGTYPGAAGMSVSGGVGSVSSANKGVAEFPADVHLANWTAIAVIREDSAPGNNYASWLGDVSIGNGGPIAYVSRNGAAFDWRFDSSHANSYQHAGGIDLTGSFKTLTYRYDGTRMETWLGDMRMFYLTQAGMAATDTERFYFGINNLTHSFNAIALYNRALSNAEIRQAVAALKIRAARSSITITPPPYTVIAEGDSITGPFIATGLYTYPFLSGPNLSPRAQVGVQAVSGSTLATVSARVTTFLANLPPSLNGRRLVLTVMVGANDLGAYSGGAAQYLTDLQAVVAPVRARGIKVCVGTLLPHTTVQTPGAATPDSTFNGRRATLNASILANTGSWHDGSFDFAGVSGMGADSDCTNATNYYDGWHPTDAGQVLLEPVYTSAVNTALNAA